MTIAVLESVLNSLMKNIHPTPLLVVPHGKLEIGYVGVYTQELANATNKTFIQGKQLLNIYCSVQFTSVQSLSRVRLFATPWIAARQASLSITNSQSSPRLASIKSVMPSSHLILCLPLLLCPQSLPALKSFPMSQFFAWGGQSTGVSASTPKKSQGWSPSEWTGWIPLLSKGLSRVFSNITVQKHQFYSSQLSSQSNSHIHTWPLGKP